MQRKYLELSDELLKKLSIEEIAELKIETDELLESLNNIIDICNE
mgnify:FL=1